MKKLLMIMCIFMMLLLCGCARNTTEDSTSSLTDITEPTNDLSSVTEETEDSENTEEVTESSAEVENEALPTKPDWGETELPRIPLDSSAFDDEETEPSVTTPETEVPTESEGNGPSEENPAGTEHPTEIPTMQETEPDGTDELPSMSGGTEFE